MVMPDTTDMDMRWEYPSLICLPRCKRARVAMRVQTDRSDARLTTGPGLLCAPRRPQVHSWYSPRVITTLYATPKRTPALA